MYIGTTYLSPGIYANKCQQVVVAFVRLCPPVLVLTFVRPLDTVIVS